MSKSILLRPKIYNKNDIDLILNELRNIEFIKTQKRISYGNIPCCLDIETSSFYEKVQNLDEKRAIMYEWTLNLDGYVIIGREWKELLYCLHKISNFFELNSEKLLIIYIHNEGYEFQFLRKKLSWDKVFALDERKPVQCISDIGLEFRCSYLLSGYSLANLGKQLTKYKVQKLDGDLDYSLLRTPKTPLTKKELQYCINDTLVVVAYIQELIERDGDITKLPLTKTGFVRNACRNKCFYDNKSHKKSSKYSKYRNLISSMVLDEFTYMQLKDAFAGGFTHASLLHAGDIVKNVSSFDFTSSYPAVMVSEKFPMSSPERIIIKSKEELYFNLTNYCCLFDIEFENIKPSVIFENYISKSKCWTLENAEENNGRIISADRLGITITEQDFLIIRKMYTWDKLHISKFIRFKKGYLPKDFVSYILEQYQIKTQLKGVKGKETEYLVSKENINSLYGMTVTDICRDEIIYNANDEWTKQSPEKDTIIDKYNRSSKRFMYYPWGIWVTAYARRNLFTGILEFKEDYVYSDTDSIKVINVDKHRNYIEEYNNKIIQKLKIACKVQNLDFELTRPKTIKNEIKQLGIWEEETLDSIYTRFKTLGAKRYLVEQNGELKITVAGLGKSSIKYMKEKYKDKVFQAFDEDLYIPKGKTGKNIHTYIDFETNGIVKDYLGIYYNYHEDSSTHLEPADYSLSLSEKYASLLLGIKQSNYAI